jgi:hypothetical protein
MKLKDLPKIKQTKNKTECKHGIRKNSGYTCATCVFGSKYILKKRYNMAKEYVIVLQNKTAKKFDKILKDENLTPDEWLENAVEDYDS